MNGDISLTETYMGGLRIANPDDEPASPATIETSTSQPLTSQPPSNAPPDSRSTITQEPIHYEEDAAPAARPIGPADAANIHDQPFSPHLLHRPARPHTTDYSQQTISNPSYANPTGQNRSYPPPSSRPISGMYNHSNLSGSSGISSYAAYRYGDELPSQPAGPPAGPPVSMVQRSGSRATASGLPVLGRIPSERHSANRMVPPSAAFMDAGMPPPRRSSRRILPSNHLPATTSGSPYGIEGGPLPSSEEWKERGAATSIRQEVDANGRTVQRVTKKGVKDFNFGRTLGEGSYSTVLAATDRQTLREYAIKVLDKRHIIKEKKVKYVNIEKDTLNRLTEHPGIVRLYYTFQDERSLYFVLDLASGGELLGTLKKIGSFDEECTRFYGAQILDAIDYMHSKGVIHRDLKPENVLLDSHMHVKITDFGTAKILNQPKAKAEGSESSAGDPLDGVDVDRAMSFVGTAEYVSPELLTNKNACKASDLWAFGCIIYQLLTGRPPFKAGNEYQTFQKIVGLDYTFPDGFSPVARDLVERLLVLDPAKRLPIEHIKNHRFFDGVTWGKGMWKQKAPRLRAYAAPAQEPIRLNAAPSSLVPLNTPLPIRPNPRLVTELPPPSQLDIEWSPVLTRNNERILKLGNLNVTVTSQPHSPNSKNGEQSNETSKKLSRFFGGANITKKRTRLVMVTSSARLVLAASGGDEKKAKLDVPLLAAGTTWKSFKDAKGLTVWSVDTPSKHMLFEDPKATPIDPDGSMYSAQEWMEVIDNAREFAISQSVTSSYPNDPAFNDLSSTLSSPTSTLGAENALDGVNVPTARLRKGDIDNESMKGRKRFSKRHSKSGLAAVF